mmetsp:Transcript_25178/g.65707  ORF Transcript_25178/g.65707 Transcript_25178/m.65707 type:complete len:724 (+) Transcript_25178:96-2267(+)
MLRRYKVIEEIGKGSYGEVVLVRGREDGKKWALKKLNITGVPEEQRTAALREAKLMRQLSHPNLVRFKEEFCEKGNLYIVMQFCQGGDLNQKLRRQKELLPEWQVMEWTVQVALALQYLHEHRILHRDLKTQNIFLLKKRRDGKQHIMLGDLGIARQLTAEAELATTFIGTPYYMSPELFSNAPYNYKSDVWALGCCIYEMATLHQAFNARDMCSLVRCVINGEVPRIPAKYSDALDAAIQQMLSPDADDRPTVHEFLKQGFVRASMQRFLDESLAVASKRSTSVTSTASEASAGGGGEADPLLDSAYATGTSTEPAAASAQPDEACCASSATEDATASHPTPITPTSPAPAAAADTEAVAVVPVAVHAMAASAPVPNTVPERLAPPSIMEPAQSPPRSPPRGRRSRRARGSGILHCASDHNTAAAVASTASPVARSVAGPDHRSPRMAALRASRSHSGGSVTMTPSSACAASRGSDQPRRSASGDARRARESSRRASASVVASPLIAGPVAVNKRAVVPDIQLSDDSSDSDAASDDDSSDSTHGRDSMIDCLSKSLTADHLSMALKQHHLTSPQSGSATAAATLSPVTPAQQAGPAEARSVRVSRTSMPRFVGTPVSELPEAPLGGPLAQWATSLRKRCIKELGEESIYRGVIEIMTSPDPMGDREERLMSCIGPAGRQNRELIALLQQAELCERLLDHLNREVVRPKPPHLDLSLAESGVQ